MKVCASRVRSRRAEPAQAGEGGLAQETCPSQRAQASWSGCPISRGMGRMRGCHRDVPTAASVSERRANVAGLCPDRLRNELGRMPNLAKACIDAELAHGCANRASRRRAEGKRGRAPPGPFARKLGRSPIFRHPRKEKAPRAWGKLPGPGMEASLGRDRLPGGHTQGVSGDTDLRGGGPTRLMGCVRISSSARALLIYVALSLGDESVRLVPVFSRSHIDFQRHGQLGRGAHAFFQARGDLPDPIFTYFEDELVVDLQDHACMGNVKRM